MNTYQIEYKAIAYFAKNIKANSEKESIKIAKNLPESEFQFIDTLDGSWKFSQITKEGDENRTPKIK